MSRNGKTKLAVNEIVDGMLESREHNNVAIYGRRGTIEVKYDQEKKKR